MYSPSAAPAASVSPLDDVCRKNEVFSDWPSPESWPNGDEAVLSVFTFCPHEPSSVMVQEDSGLKWSGACSTQSDAFQILTSSNVHPSIIWTAYPHNGTGACGSCQWLRGGDIVFQLSCSQTCEKPSGAWSLVTRSRQVQIMVHAGTNSSYILVPELSDSLMSMLENHARKQTKDNAAIPVRLCDRTTLHYLK